MRLCHTPVGGLRLPRTHTHPRMDRNVAIYLHLGYSETHRDTTGDIPRLHLEKKLSSTPASS